MSVNPAKLLPMLLPKGKATAGELIFDDVHSYLPPRKEAEKGHEIDLVNQFLISMETTLGFLSAPPI